MTHHNLLDVAILLLLALIFALELYRCLRRSSRDRHPPHTHRRFRR